MGFFLLTFFDYYKKIMSNSRYDTAAVYAIQTKLIPEINKTVPNVKKIYPMVQNSILRIDFRWQT